MAEIEYIFYIVILLDDRGAKLPKGRMIWVLTFIAPSLFNILDHMASLCSANASAKHDPPSSIAFVTSAVWMR